MLTALLKQVEQFGFNWELYREGENKYCCLVTKFPLIVGYGNIEFSAKGSTMSEAVDNLIKEIIRENNA